MGTGKTSTGRVLARKLETRFIDTDKLIEKEAGIVIREIFDKSGEPHFRRLEREIVKKVSAENGIVIAVGGGAIVNPANLADLKRRGIVVSLTATPEVILSRVEKNAEACL
ncbi:MAG: hypothetical protein HY786_02720 [Deltaproteobacteria bacterium]|nr:hypothetical protein [Deltaproteobacteria bacterium]